MTELVKRKTIRLPRDAYREPGSSWLVTIAAHADRRPFLDPSLGGATVAMLLDEAPRRGIDLHLACLLPDHAHLVATVIEGDLVSAVGALKSRSTLLYHGFGYRGPLWQRSFHDHGLRSEEAFTSMVRYVLENPIVAGLAGTWEEYDLIGGALVGRP